MNEYLKYFFLYVFIGAMASFIAHLAEFAFLANIGCLATFQKCDVGIEDHRALQPHSTFQETCKITRLN